MNLCSATPPGPNVCNCTYSIFNPSARVTLITTQGGTIFFLTALTEGSLLFTSDVNISKVDISGLLGAVNPDIVNVTFSPAHNILLLLAERILTDWSSETRS